MPGGDLEAPPARDEIGNTLSNFCAQTDNRMTPKLIADYLIQNRLATRTRRGTLCPVCDHFDGHCPTMDHGSAALCPKSDGTGSVRKYGEYGYLYILSPGIQTNAVCLPPVVKRPERTDQEMDAIWRPRVAHWQDRGRIEIGRLASTLGVSIASLRELSVGWDGKAWTTPERSAAGLIVGVSRRFQVLPSFSLNQTACIVAAKPVYFISWSLCCPTNYE